jgi:hypothetical protein
MSRLGYHSDPQSGINQQLISLFNVSYVKYPERGLGYSLMVEPHGGSFFLDSRALAHRINPNHKRRILMGIASLVVAIFALILAVVGLIPLIGFVEWIALVLGLISGVFGLVGIIKRWFAPLALTGLIISIVAIVLALLRLALGGWFI